MHTRTHELLDYLDSQRAVLRNAFESVPPALRDRPPAPDRWSTAGVVDYWFAFIGAHEARHAAQIREITADTVAR